MEKNPINHNQGHKESSGSKTITASKNSSGGSGDSHKDKDLKAAHVHVSVTHSFSSEKEIYQDIFPRLVNNSILLNDLFEELTHKNCILTNTAISYYDDDLKTFIFCGILPFTGNVTVPYKYQEGIIPIIHIRSRQLIHKDNLMRMELNEESQEQDENNQNIFINVKSKRSKERKIGYIIEKVFLWRKLYNGFIDDKGNLVKLTLEEAADKVGISKKSLDDYLIQLRYVVIIINNIYSVGLEDNMALYSMITKMTK